MFKTTKRYLITGGCGFIGSSLIRRLLRLPKTEIINFDKLAYTASLKSLMEFNKNPRHHHIKADLADFQAIQHTLDMYRPDAIIHLAADTPTDNVIKQPDPFIHSNIIGTYNLLTASLELWQKHVPHLQLHHVSTDEVFGRITGDRLLSETSNYAPYSPYAASKAASDHLVRAWHKTYDLPITISHSGHNYGPFQHHEKQVPTIVRHCLEHKPILVDGNDQNIRDWLYIDDHVDALLAILEKGKIGNTYMIGGDCEQRNVDLIHHICDLMDQYYPARQAYRTLITQAKDCSNHYRHGTDSSKIQHELGWRPTTFLKEGLIKTIRWHVQDYYTTHHPKKVAQ
ncbi:MAG: GDP-mannose 4,6-dehydratase [Candidatus Paracaedibacteraceae bacterium]|nr:GDP-mannose 4,6-dehydratase [Candidatus Paracaedibacteraceae bacterium]